MLCMYTQLRRSKPGSRVIDDLTLEMTIITEWLREGEIGSVDSSTATGADSTAAVGESEDESKSVSQEYGDAEQEEEEGAVVGGGGNSGMMNEILQNGDNTASRSTHTSPTTSTSTKGAPSTSSSSLRDDQLRLDIDSESESDTGDWPEDDFDDLMDTLIMQGDDIPEGIIDDDEFERHMNNMVKKSSAASSTLTVTNTAEKPKKPKKVSSVSDSNRQPTSPSQPAEPIYIPLYYDDDDDDVIEFVGARGSSFTPMDYERLLDSN